MGAQHTPGPWRAANSAEVIGVPSGFICLCGDPDVDPTPTDHANARLIAAAPDLLEALSELFQEVGKTGWKAAAPIPSERNGRADMLNRARAAIDLATVGRTQAAVRAMARDGQKTEGRS